MNYNLNEQSGEHLEQKGFFSGMKTLWPHMSHEKGNLIWAMIAIVSNSILNLVSPAIMGHAIDAYISAGNYHGLFVSGGVILTIYICALVTNYLQTRLMGGVAQRVLFKLRNSIFKTLQDLPVAFFNQNKAGDLISRINNDTEKLNEFFSRSLMQFIGSGFIMIGAAIFVLSINPILGALTLLPALFLVGFNQIVAGWVKRTNTRSAQSIGNLSSEIQESLANFRVIIAFNRRDYFRDRLNRANSDAYSSAVKAGISNGIFTPVYDLAADFGQVIVLVAGISFILQGSFTVGFLISFLAYATNVYNPLRHLARLWASFQVAMASWDRIRHILGLESNLQVVKDSESRSDTPSILEFKNVHFSYPDSKEILHNISFNLETGKTYALVGPTGGGKTTTASLMARLYDPTRGTVFFDDKDIRSYKPAERTSRIGFILQEAFLFTGTVKENILYGNEQYEKYSNEQLETAIKNAGLSELLFRFEKGLDTAVENGGELMSLGQRQIIAFMRAVLRNPDILILDEATANIDSVTEQILENILNKLPKKTTKVIIAHRLNTIENADEIFFVNDGTVVRAGSMEHAVDMLLKGKKTS